MITLCYAALELVQRMQLRYTRYVACTRSWYLCRWQRGIGNSAWGLSQGSMMQYYTMVRGHCFMLLIVPGIFSCKALRHPDAPTRIAPAANCSPRAVKHSLSCPWSSFSVVKSSVCARTTRATFAGPLFWCPRSCISSGCADGNKLANWARVHDPVSRWVRNLVICGSASLQLPSLHVTHGGRSRNHGFAVISRVQNSSLVRA